MTRKPTGPQLSETDAGAGTAAQADLDRRFDALRAEESEFDARRRAFERERARLERELEEARRTAREAGAALAALEAERAYDLEALDEARQELSDGGPEVSIVVTRRLEHLDRELTKAHETIRAMQRTRVWRVGSAWWRLRGRIFGGP